MFHTFIGSFEVKYLLWLLVALIFSSSQDFHSSLEKIDHNQLEEKRLKRRLFYSLLFGLLALYGISFLWCSTHSLSLASRTQEFHLIQEFGLDRIEKDAEGREFRWSGRAAALPLTINGPWLRLALHASHPDIEKRPVTVDFKLLRPELKLYRSLPAIKLNKQEWVEVKFNVGEEIGQEFILLIRVNRTWNPYREAGIKDLRNLGVAITNPWFSSEK